MKRKRKWYQDYYWEHIPYAIAYMITKNIKLIIYVLTISFAIIQVGRMTLTTEASADIQKILQEQKDAETEKAKEKAKLRQYEIEAESRAREQAEEEKAKYNQTLNEKHKTEAVSKIYPKGTYLRNKATKEVGQVKEIQGERVITNTFYFDATDCMKNEDIEYISYNEWKKELGKLQEKEFYNKRKTTKEEDERFLEDYKKLETELRAKFPQDQKYSYMEWNGEYYRIKGYDGAILILENGKRVYGFDENMHYVDFIEFDKARAKKWREKRGE